MMLIVAPRLKDVLYSITLMWKANTQTIIVLVASFLLALTIVYTGFVNALIALFLVGAIPGTSLNIPPTIMLIGFAVTALLLLFQSSHKSARRIITKKRRQLQRQARKRQLPKRRYSRI